jgi:tRNA (pseudouridine54-N1)-methyltransferase
MRTFIVLGHKTAISPDFTLNDLPGSAGRLDILCRCINSSFLLSHGIRKDVCVYLVLRNQVVLRFEGSRLKHLNPDERSTGALIQKALEKRDQIDDAEEIESTPGIFITNSSLKDVVKKVGKNGTKIFMLHEEGRDIREVTLPENSAFMLSDHLNFSPEEEKVLASYDRLSLGPKILHADHAIIVLHNEMDRIFCG